jgi:hypothetical protein
MRYRTARYDIPVEGDEEKHLLIGFNSIGNPIEILYIEILYNEVQIDQPAHKDERNHLAVSPAM